MRVFRALALMALFILGACSPAAPAPAPTGGQAPQPAEKRSANQAVKIAQIGLPASMTPESAEHSKSVYWLMYDDIVSLDDKFNATPSVAERWELVNPTTWRLYIRKDLSFPNGDKLTGEDVAFTGQFTVQNKVPPVSQILSVVDVKLVDQYTVDFINKAPDASTLAGLAALWVYPKKYFESVGREGFAAKPMGSGPYELTEFRSADFARFKLRASGHPFRKAVPTEITVQAAPELNTITSGLRTGDIDIALGQFTPDQIQTMTKADIVIEKRFLSNLHAFFPLSGMEARQTPLNDKRVRLALNYAMDKEGLAKSLYKGEALPAGQMGIPSSPFWDPDIKPIPYDPAMAKKLLAEAGYPNGFKLPLGIDFAPQFTDRNVVLAIQSNFRDVGVDLPLIQNENGIHLDKFFGRNGQVLGDLFMLSSPDANGFNSNLRGYYGCEKPPGNVYWCNKTFDEAMAQAAAEPDVAKRAVLMRKASRAMVDDVAQLNLVVIPQYVVYSPKIKGFKWTSDQFYTFDTVYRID